MKKVSGFSLIEVMIVVAIIAIITAIALPSYQNSVTKSRRAEAKSMLLQAAQKQEQAYSENSTYATEILTEEPNGGVAANQIVLPATSESGFYTLGINGADGTLYTFTATPIGSFSDPVCNAFELNNFGAKTITGTGRVDECW